MRCRYIIPAMPKQFSRIVFECEMQFCNCKLLWPKGDPMHTLMLFLKITQKFDETKRFQEILNTL